MALADLHTHTACSDGRLSPAGLVEKASLRGLAAVAITDHDTVSGLGIAAVAAARHGIRLITGVELSASVDGRDAHILGYAFDPRDETLRRHLADYREARVERARAIVDRLEELGVPVSWGRVMSIAAGAAVGRPHIARALVEAGHVATFGEAFDRFLGDGGAAYVRKPPVAPGTIFDLIHQAGGKAVLAHPGLAFSEADVRELRSLGLDGIEAVHPSHDPMLESHWKGTAARLGLFVTGGSDYHGYRAVEEEHFGRLGIPDDRLDVLN